MAAGIDAPACVSLPFVWGGTWEIPHRFPPFCQNIARSDEPLSGAISMRPRSVTPCFTPGTAIVTDRGAVPVERLRPGDKVVTRDNGLRRIYWVGRRDVTYRELAVEEELVPVVVRAGAFGDGVPLRDMVVSPSHRFLVAPDQAFLAMEEESLVAVRHLVGGRGVARAQSLGVSYIHLLCDAHQVILADGVWTETFHPDDQVMRGLGNSQRREILALFPEVGTMGAALRFPAVRDIRERP